MMNRDLFISILSLDAYNRGYDSYISDPLPDALGAAIGGAYILTDSTRAIDLPSTSKVGFYAIAYDWNGTTVISYRGTNYGQKGPLSPDPGLSADILNGWSMFTGLGPTTQAALASQFYQTVTGFGFIDKSKSRRPVPANDTLN